MLRAVVTRWPWSHVVRAGERRRALLAAVFLLLFFVGQAVLEAARDTLFLSKVPAARLPWMYIVIALLSFGVVRAEERKGRRSDSADALVAWTSVAALGTLVLAIVLLGGAGSDGKMAGVYATYVWSGLVTSLVVSRFWALLGAQLSITDAKRLYGVIGAGAVVGAIVGSAGAGVAALVVTADLMLFGAVAAFALAAGVGLLLRRSVGEVAAPPRGRAPPLTLIQAITSLSRARYQQRVVALIVLGAATLTVGDFVFKSAVVAFIAPDTLGVFFGALGFVSNSLSLIVQLVVGPRVIAKGGVVGALVVLPLVLAAGGAGVAAGAGVLAAVLMRVGDGALRYSIHRTASELLFVPMRASVRGAMKVLDVLGQRLGQALASVALLVAASGLLSTELVAVALVVMALVWFGGVLELRQHYLDVFRGDLRAGRLGDSVRLRGLDQAALETVLTALDSSEDAEVLAALALLEREKKAHLVPALILHHPSVEVTTHATSLFLRTKRVGVVPTLDRVAGDAAPSRRATAIVARQALVPDAPRLARQVEAESIPELRVVLTLLLARVRGGASRAPHEILPELEAVPTARLWLAAVLAVMPRPGDEPLLIELAHAPEPDVRRAIVFMLAQVRTPPVIAGLVPLLADEATRDEATHALALCGTDGLGAITRALRDDRTPATLAWHLPRALTSFPAEQALPVLLGCMQDSRDGMVRYRCLRAVERLAAIDTSLVVDRRILRSEIDEAVRRAVWCLSRRVALREATSAERGFGTVSQGLLIDLLADKERHAIDRLLRLLGLWVRTADLAHVRRGLVSEDPRLVGSALELLGHLLPVELRDTVLPLVSARPERDRLASMDVGELPRPDEVIEELAASGEPNFIELVHHHRAAMATTEVR